MDNLAQPVLLAQANLSPGGTTETTAEPVEPYLEEGSFTYSDFGAWAAGAVILAVFVFLAFKLFRGVDTITGKAELQEVDFAQQLEELTGLTGRPVDLAAANRASESSPQSPRLTRASNTDPWSGGPLMATSFDAATMAEGSTAESLEELARKLTALRVIGDLEGWVPLPVPPEAPIYKLRAGGSCVLLPRLESPDTMEFFSRRFKIVFAMCPKGEVVVLERFQDRVGEMMESPLR